MLHGIQKELDTALQSRQIIDARIEKKLTQKQLAQLAGTKQSNIALSRN